MEQNNQSLSQPENKEEIHQEEIISENMLMPEQASTDHSLKSLVIIGGALIALFIVLVGGYMFFFNTTAGPVKESVTVRLGWVHQAQFAGFYVAKEKGFYDAAGLDVELLELDSGVNQVEELSGGSVNFSVLEAHQALVGIDEGLDLKAVMAVYQINPHVLATREDSGIKGPEDFAGKVIGLSGGEGEGNALLKIFVERFGNADKVTYINLGFNSIDDFINNRADIIDLYRTDQPYLAEKQGVPLHIIALDAYGFSTYGDVVLTNSDMLTTRKEVVARFVEATRRGWEYALTHQEEAVSITLPYTSGEYNDIDYQRHIIHQSAPLVRGSQEDFGRMDFVSWSTLYESMRSAGALTRDLNITNVYTNEFIE